jgi:hypothetical protein
MVCSARCRAERRHLFRLGQRAAQRPLAEDGLAGLQARHDELPVTGHPHADDDEIDVTIARHVAEPVKRALRPERSRGRPGGVLVRGAHRFQLVAGQRLERGHVGVLAPAAAALGDGGADDADTDRAHGWLRSGMLLAEAASKGDFVTVSAWPPPGSP